MTQVSLGFIPETLSVPLERILLSRKIPEGIIGSRKFVQIRASIEEVGLIEPLSVSPVKAKSEDHLLLDGHVRLLALRELKYTVAPCLVAKDDEAYTYNKQVNRLSTIQEHFMIKRAIERGVSKERLAKALSINLDSMMRKATLLDGICSEASDLLQDRQFSSDLARVLRKMKTTRQVECVELMVAANNVTVSYAEALLVATPSEMLVDGKKPQKLQGVTQEQMFRMEREMANLQGQYKLVEETYGQDMLNLVLARGYLVKLLENKSVAKQLQKRQPEFMEQFLSIIETTSLEGSGQFGQSSS
jgi:hypothetical protein